MDGLDYNDYNDNMTHPRFMTHWLWGVTEPVWTRAAQDAHVLQGDLLFQDENGKARPASDFPQGPDFEERFAHRFLGVAGDSSRFGDGKVIRVFTTGTFEYHDATALADGEEHQLGEYVGIVPGESRALTWVESAQKAIARVTHTENVPAGWVYVGILSTIIHGGVPGTDPTHRKD